MRRPLRRMMFRLAAHLSMTVGELEERMTSNELAEWQALIYVDPWGAYRSDIQHALNAWSPLVAAGAKSKVEDFLPHDPCAEKRDEVKDLKSFLTIMARA